jgi:hypothetical protein
MITRVAKTVTCGLVGYYCIVSPTAMASALVVEMFMNIALVNKAPIGVASIRVYRPYTGFTVASKA